MSDKVIYYGENAFLSPAEILEIFTSYLSSEAYEKIEMYGEYYEGENCEIEARFRDRAARRKTPNNKIPTAYYSSVVDAMAGYLFSDVKYQGRTDQDAAYIEALQAILDANNVTVKDMSAGVRALAYNKAYELVYTTGDGNGVEIRVASIDPESAFCIYNNDIEPKMICGVRFTNGTEKGIDYNLDVFYASAWERYKVTAATEGKRQILPVDVRPLYFPACPMIEYNAEAITDNSPFAVILPYVDALDILLSGNSNEVERLTDALLVLGKVLQDEDLKHLDELKALMNFKNEDRAEFIQRQTDPAFRQYVSDVLTREIHKHSHVIDWYGGDATTGALSAKAYRTRLHDMDVYSKRIEQVYRDGAQKRISLITFLMALTAQPVGLCDIVFNRTIPSDVEDKIAAVNLATFISDVTKQEFCGFDPEIEGERMQEQKDAAMKSAIDATALFENNNHDTPQDNGDGVDDGDN